MDSAESLSVHVLCVSTKGRVGLKPGKPERSLRPGEGGRERQRERETERERERERERETERERCRCKRFMFVLHTPVPAKHLRLGFKPGGLDRPPCPGEREREREREVRRPLELAESGLCLLGGWTFF